MTDAHCHPFDLLGYLNDPEAERRETGTAAAASSCGLEEFEYHEGLARKAREDAAPPLFCCFALHPQLAPHFMEGAALAPEKENKTDFSLRDGLALLQTLASEKRLDAIGEAGFDLYNEKYRASEKIQDEMFPCHLETALKYDLPMVIHVRKAMHKIYPFAKELKKLPAVVFHSWPGTRGEGEALLKRGINAWFSFGTVILKNHKAAMDCAAFFPPGRILFETDAPYQPLKEREYSSWRDLDIICRGIAALRKEAGNTASNYEELERITTENFFRVFGRKWDNSPPFSACR